MLPSDVSVATMGNHIATMGDAFEIKDKPCWGEGNSSKAKGNRGWHPTP